MYLITLLWEVLSLLVLMGKNTQEKERNRRKLCNYIFQFKFGFICHKKKTGLNIEYHKPVQDRVFLLFVSPIISVKIFLHYYLKNCAFDIQELEIQNNLTCHLKDTEIGVLWLHCASCW